MTCFAMSILKNNRKIKKKKILSLLNCHCLRGADYSKVVAQSSSCAPPTPLASVMVYFNVGIDLEEDAGVHLLSCIELWEIAAYARELVLEEEACAGIVLALDRLCVVGDMHVHLDVLALDVL